MHSALHGVKVLEVGTTTPGKFTGFLLVGWGADSLRIERPISAESKVIDDEDLTLNRGKRSLTLNLREPEGREILMQLASTADVFMESYRPGTAERLGIGAETMRACNPRLVYCSLSGFGQTGPDKHRVAYDLNIQAETGFSNAMAGANKPDAPQTYLADSVSGLMAAFAITAALRGREVTGEGATLDLGVQESLFSLLAVSHGTMRPNTSPLEMRAAYGVFECAGGTLLSLGVARKVSADTLFEHLGRPELADTGLLRGEAGAEARSFLIREFQNMTAAEWLTELAPLGLEVAPVNTPEQAFADPQLRHRSMVLEQVHPSAGNLQQIGIPGVDGETLTPAPALGSDTETILQELGFEPARIAALRTANII